jgi:hypothetical protein
MKAAALEWPKAKIKILNRQRREERKKAKEREAVQSVKNKSPQKVDE